MIVGWLKRRCWRATHRRSFPFKWRVMIEKNVPLERVVKKWTGGMAE